MVRDGTARPPSPPHSLNGDTSTSDVKRAEPHMPYTPPRSILPASAVENTWDSYGDPSMYHTAPEPMFYSPQPVFVRTMQYQTPPSTTSDSGMYTRNNRAVGTPSTPNPPRSSHRPQSPRRKRLPRSKIGKKGGPVLDKPLSVLTKDYSVPIRDMNAWVTRPVEERLKEAERKKGHISRPMNSFMLYRSAYADRVKRFCKENNHQVVSQVTGASWPMEPQHVREEYEKFANMERDNHQAAFPNYKFAPNKNGKKRLFNNDDDNSDDDPDWEGSTRSTKRSRSDRREDTRSLSNTPFDDERVAHYHQPIRPYQQVQYHPSSYQFSNPHGPQPFVLGPNGMVGQYYESNIHLHDYGNVEDVSYRPIEDPFANFDFNGPLVGMPDAGHPDLVSPLDATKPRLAEHVQMVDPQLERLESNYHITSFDGNTNAFEIPRVSFGEYQPQEDVIYHQSMHPGMATLTDDQNGWSVKAHAGADFDDMLKWDQ